MSNKATGYNLFQSNALKYGWPVTPPRLIWQNELGVSFTYANALIYAQYLEEDGVTVSATPQNVWRIPTIDELIIAQVNSTFLGEARYPGGFLTNRLYWCRYGEAPARTDIYYRQGDFDFGGTFIDVGINYVRCVKI